MLAVQHIRRMRGGAQSHLMLGEDGNAYVVKFQNNPQYLRVLANELMATKLAAAVGLPVPECEVLDVTPWLIENVPELDMEFGLRRERCKPGLCFASRFVGGLWPGQLMDFLPDKELGDLLNIEDFAGILAFDKWTCNADGRQAVYSRKLGKTRYTATFIDFGYCFNAGEWIFRDSPLRGIFGRKVVYGRITGWSSLEPWLGRIEHLRPEMVYAAAQSIPKEWYNGRDEDIHSLVKNLIDRRSQVRDLIDEYRKSSHRPFPSWVEM